jgi:hypothetical protein
VAILLSLRHTLLALGCAQAIIASAIETSEFQGALLSGQNRAAQQGKTKKLSFNVLSIDGMTGTVKHAPF